MKKKLFLIITSFIAIIGILYGSIRMFILKKEYQKVNDTYEEIQNICIEEKRNDEEMINEAENFLNENEILNKKMEEEGEFSVNWEELRNINKDTIAWIKIDGTNISYPIVQGEDNEKYVKKDIYGDKSKGGCIFVDSKIENPFHSLNTIIYGHNLNDGAMFNALKNYSNEDFANNHKNIHIYLPDEERDYEVFAFCKVNEYNDEIYNTSIINLEKYYQKIEKYNQINIDNNIDNSRPIIMLSTCTNNKKSERYVVFAQYMNNM